MTVLPEQPADPTAPAGRGRAGDPTEIGLARVIGEMTRRDFIRRSAAGIAGLTLAQVLLPGCSPGRPTPSDLQALGPVEFATLSAAADRIMDGMNYPGGADAVTSLFDRSLAAVPPWNRSLFLDAMRFLEFSPLLFSFPPGRFSTRTAEARDQILQDMADSTLLIRRQVFAAVKQAVLFTAYSQPATWPALAYDGPGAIFADRRRGR